MKRMDPRQADLAFVSPATPMFSEIMQRIEDDVDLSEGRKRDLISGLRRVARALGRAPQEVPADTRWLQPRLAAVAPAALGLTAKSWQNALSDARSAMGHVGIVKRRNRRLDELAPAWQDLWTSVRASQDRSITAALYRFVHFLNTAGVAPDRVTQADAEAYLVALEADEISKSPQGAWRAAINNWNLAQDRIAGWPMIRLSLPRRQVVHKLPDDALSPEFLDDLAALMRRMAAPDPFAETGPSRPLRPNTLFQYERQIKRFASILVTDGVPARDIPTVAALCDPRMAERGLRVMVARRGNRTGKLIAETAALLRNLATKLDLGADVRKRLVGLAAKVAVPAQKGMTEKNSTRLRVLQDEKVLRRLLDLPEVLFDRAMKKGTPYAAALAREEALAIALLLACPVRISNIAGIHIEQHLQRPGDGRVFLVLAGEEVKNALPIEFELPDDVRRMITRHLASRSPLLCPPGTPWLFPLRNGSGPMDGNVLSSRLRKRIRKEIGVVMNAHLFRHLAAMIWLDANPGAYEAARRLLGHSELSHTINLYSGLEARSAMQAYGRVLAEKRGRKP